MSMVAGHQGIIHPALYFKNGCCGKVLYCKELATFFATNDRKQSVPHTRLLCDHQNQTCRRELHGRQTHLRCRGTTPQTRRPKTAFYPTIYAIARRRDTCRTKRRKTKGEETMNTLKGLGGYALNNDDREYNANNPYCCQ